MVGLTLLFFIVGLIGFVYLLVSLVFGVLTDVSGDVLESIDDALEGIGIDLIPDEIWEETDTVGKFKGIGCSSLAAFLAGFGSTGFAATLYKMSPFWSIFLAVASGILLGLLYILIMTFFYRQQSNMLIQESDFIGLKANSTIDSPAGEIGQVSVDVKGNLCKYPAVEITGKELKRGDVVIISELKGGKLYVEKKN